MENKKKVDFIENIYLALLHLGDDREYLNNENYHEKFRILKGMSFADDEILYLINFLLTRRVIEKPKTYIA